jgi:hypothetical protein
LAKGGGAGEGGVGDGLDFDAGELTEVGQMAAFDNATSADDADTEVFGGDGGHLLREGGVAPGEGLG